MKVRLERLLEATAQNKGDDVSFLERWKYDKHQKEAITLAIHSVAEAWSNIVSDDGDALKSSFQHDWAVANQMPNHATCHEHDSPMAQIDAGY